MCFFRPLEFCLSSKVETDDTVTGSASVTGGESSSWFASFFFFVVALPATHPSSLSKYPGLKFFDILSEILVGTSSGNSFFLFLLARLELELEFGCGALGPEFGPILTVGTLVLPDCDRCGTYERVLLT